MSAIISYGSFNPTSMTIVPVIASFSDEGKIRPLYLGVGRESYKILSSYELDNDPFCPVRIYRCEFDDHGRRRQIEITYHSRESFWSIPKRSTFQ